MFSSTFSNSTPDFLLNSNNFSFFNNNANIPVPLTNNKLPYSNKILNNYNSKDDLLNSNNNNNNNNYNNYSNNNKKIKENNNNIEYDVPSLSPQISNFELFQPPPPPQQQQQQKSTLIVESSVPQFPQYCSLKKCELCERGQPALLLKTPTWSSIMRVVFFTLHNEYPEKQYFSLKTEVYEFMTSHWEKLCINRKRTDNWRKQIQDMLSHSKNVFESGLEKLKQNGFWKLRNIIDPWVINEKSTSSSSPNESSPLINNNNRKKRSLEIYDNDNNNTNNNNNNNNSENKKSKSPQFTPISSPNLNSSNYININYNNNNNNNDQTLTPTTTIAEIESIEQIFNKEIQSIRIETKKLFKLLPSMKHDQSLTKEILTSIQNKLLQYENRLNSLEKEKESFKITLPLSPLPISNNNYSEPSSPSQQIPPSPSESTDVSRSNSPIPSPQKNNNTNTNTNCNSNSNSQKLFFV